MAKEDEPTRSQRVHEAHEDLSLYGSVEIDEDIATEDDVDGARNIVLPGQEVEPLERDPLPEPRMNANEALRSISAAQEILMLEHARNGCCTGICAAANPSSWPALGSTASCRVPT